MLWFLTLAAGACGKRLWQSVREVILPCRMDNRLHVASVTDETRLKSKKTFVEAKIVGVCRP